MTPLARVVNDFPYPVALPYSLVFDRTLSASDRRWALCFTQYQLLRVVCLPLVSQYLLEENLIATRQQEKAIRSLNTCIAGLKSPFFTDWVTAVQTLPKHLASVGVNTLFPQLPAALKALDTPTERPFGTRKTNILKPLDAIVALRNATAHGGLGDPAEAERHIESYLPVLHEVLTAFDFVGDCRLYTHDDPAVTLLRGTTPIPTEVPPAVWEAFADSPAVVVGPDGRAVPLFPLVNPKPAGEPLFLYDGHYGIRVDGKSAAEDSYVYYLGTYHRRQDRDSVARLQELLARRDIHFFTEKADTAPWTIADHVLDYSHAALDELKETGKYLPECYVPVAELNAHLDAFLNRSRATGFVLVGLAGHGKTALLAHLAEDLLKQDDHAARRENPNLVLFLRGNGLYPHPEHMLFRNVLEKAGGLFGGKGFGTAREFLEHLHARRKSDRVDGRRLVLVLDAVNEGPFPERVTHDALEMIREAAKYDWVKVVVSTRIEWLGEFGRKQDGGGSTALEDTRPHLYVTDPPRPGEQPRPPVVHLDPPSPDQAEQIYTRFQTTAAHRLPPCPTPWADLTADTREVLRNPLHMRLFMEVFSGKPAEPVTTKPRLYQRYVDGIRPGKESFRAAVSAVLAPLLASETRQTSDLTDDDVTAIRNAFYHGLPPEDRLYRERTQFHPAETLAAEGLLTKRVRIDGGGYKFVYQEVAEYLIFRELRDAMPKGEGEFAYWLKLAMRETAFAEYAGAFLFLFRAWEQSDEKREYIGRLVEQGAEWTGDVLTKLLDELAKVEFVPGKASIRGERLAEELAKGDSERVANSLHDAGLAMWQTRHAPTAVPYYRSSADVRERLVKSNLSKTTSARGLGRWLNKLVGLLGAPFRRFFGVAEGRYRQSPGNTIVTYELARSLTNLGNLLMASGRVGEAETAYRRSVQINGDLHRQNPGDLEVADRLARVQNNLGILLRDAGRVGEAETAHHRSVQIYDDLHRRNPGNAEVATNLGAALNGLANLFQTCGRVGEAETAYRRSVQINGDLHRQNPGNVKIASLLCSALNNLGNLLEDTGRVGEAEAAFRRSVQVREELHRYDPGNVEVADGLASGLINLGAVLHGAGRVAEGEAALRRSVQIYDDLVRHDPSNVEVATNLGVALEGLWLLLRDAGCVTDAKAAFRRSAQVFEELYRQNPGNINIMIGYAGSLRTLKRFAEARQLIDEVLAVMPHHPDASELDRWLRSQGH